jgi:ABC-type cobalamin transport system ATPase subunit
MQEELKTELGNAAKTITEAMEKWRRVKEIAEDIARWCDHDIGGFRIEVDLAVGAKIIRAWVAGAERYLMFDESINDLTVKEVLKRFLEDNRASVSMVKKLAEAIIEIANKQMECLEEQI